MLIEWKGLCPLSIGDPRVGSNYKMARVIVCMPGVNVLEDDVWDRVSKNPNIIGLLNERKLTVLREKTAAGAAKKGEASELSGMSQDEAAAIVTRTYNLEVLEEWADAETRNKVRRACEAQIQKLKITKKEE